MKNDDDHHRIFINIIYIADLKKNRINQYHYFLVCKHNRDDNKMIHTQKKRKEKIINIIVSVSVYVKVCVL